LGFHLRAVVVHIGRARGAASCRLDGDVNRDDVRAWLAEHPDPDGPTLAAAGLVAPHWPRPWGLDAHPDLQLVIDEELRRAGVELPDNPIGVGWAGPTILAGGTPEQQQRWLPAILDGSAFWCQLFSEPDAGSDLASLTTRAERDGDAYVVNGQKIWSTWAYRSDWGILLARTDPSASKQQGISYFVLDMATAGVEVRPIVEMTGGMHFSEVFLTDVRVPVDCRIGAEHGGWPLAKVTLANERVSLSEGGVLWGMGPDTDEFFAMVRKGGGIADATLRQRAAGVYTGAFVQRLLRERVHAALRAGRDPGPEASIKKTLADEHGQQVMALAKDLRGAAGMLGEAGPDAEEHDVWHWGYLFSRALTIGGGTSEVQRTIIGERLLGLPREPRP
jgi:alkylation response protein AidB-like acyl-CoA dehydrogenase